jgi:glycosyltransferase involved in cell wall biosynthesis
MNESQTKIICLTPTKNEEWILDTFLQCASIWADHIIVADQHSTDDTRRIATKYEKVILIDNNSPTFNEPERQKLLIDAARAIPCDKRILIALDADEILVGDLGFLRSEEFLSLPLGTVLTFDWLNIIDNGQKYWASKNAAPFGYVDDGLEHVGSVIHSIRIPCPPAPNYYYMENNPVLHLQYIDWNRMKSKHRWYECFEAIEFPEKSALAIYRRYHHMYAIAPSQIKRVAPKWLATFREKHIDPFAYRSEEYYRWDCEVLDLIRKYGGSRFAKLDVWDCDWQKIALLINPATTDIPQNPCSALNHVVTRYAKCTQPMSRNRFVRLLDKLISLLY